MTKYLFCLGGRDLEMEEIRKRLLVACQEIVDKNLGWGAKASEYKAEIADAAARGLTPVLVELEIDFDVPQGTIVIDHHGNRSNELASILQVLSLLGIEPDWRAQLVEANDSGGFFGLIAFGASVDEARRVMAEERKLQGFTPEMEEVSAQAVRDAEAYPEVDLTIVRLPFSRFGAAKAILWLMGRRNMVMIAEDGSREVEFQGNGAIAAAIAEEFVEKNPWSGGAGLGHVDRYDAYVGMYLNEAEKLIKFVKEELGKK